MMLKFVVLLGALCLAHAAHISKDVTTFEEFKVVYNKNYATPEKEAHAKENFYSTLKFIQENNFKDGIELGINERADLSLEEFGLMDESVASRFPFKRMPFNATKPLKELPANLDWTKKTRMAAPENQGNCGSCWAFGTVISIEAAYAIHKNQYVQLSKQQLVDCASTNYGYDSHGCFGGYPEDAMGYVKENGLVEEKFYDYVDEQDYCDEDALKNPRYKISDFHAFPQGTSDETLMQALNEHGPLTISIDASALRFRFYRSGVLRDLGMRLGVNHVITLVGYGEDENDQYWIVQNSWGESWGMDGFAYIERGQNNLNINNFAVYPIV